MTILWSVNTITAYAGDVPLEPARWQSHLRLSLPRNIPYDHLYPSPACLPYPLRAHVQHAHRIISLPISRDNQPLTIGTIITHTTLPSAFFVSWHLHFHNTHDLLALCMRDPCLARKCRRFSPLLTAWQRALLQDKGTILLVSIGALGLSIHTERALRTTGIHRIQQLLPLLSNLNAFPFLLPHQRTEVLSALLSFLTHCPLTTQGRAVMQVHDAHSARPSPLPQPIHTPTKDAPRASHTSWHSLRVMFQHYANTQTFRKINLP